VDDPRKVCKKHRRRFQNGTLNAFHAGENLEVFIRLSGEKESAEGLSRRGEKVSFVEKMQKGGKEGVEKAMGGV